MKTYRHTARPVLATLGFVLILALATGSATAANFYVDIDAPGGDGSSWPNASNDLQAILGIATSVGDVIHVAQGTYKPTAGVNRSISFIPANGVILRGSYVGYDAPNPDQRNVFVYDTILSGDIGTPDDISDNSYHVIQGSLGGIETTEFNGFIITGGNANTGDPNNKGGGALARTPLRFLNCTFQTNRATSDGGAIFTKDGAHVTIRNCIFDSNSCPQRGGAIEANGSFNPVTLSVANCLFIDNTSGNFGGAVYLTGQATATLTNCTFSGNITGGSAPALYATLQTVVRIRNSIVWENGAGGNNQISGQTEDVDILISYSDVQGTFVPGWDFGNNISSDPVFSDPVDDNYRLLDTSPAIDAGNQNLTPVDTYDVDDDTDTTEKTPDLDWRDRVIDADVDMGAYEFEDCPWDIAPVGGDCVVGAKDLIELLATWGSCADCNDCPADFDANCTVGASDLLVLLANWGRCACGATEPLSLQEELDDACLTMDDWDDFEDVMTDPESSQAKKDNYLCWMEHYLFDCNKCICIGQSGCPDADPFN